MTPQEKAEELVDKYIDLQDENLKESDYRFCKLCAIIAVDEVIKSQKNIYGLNNKATKFYLEVQQEIGKL